VTMPTGTTGPKVILLEFNELTPRLIDKFSAEGLLPNFARFRQQSQVFITNAEAEPPHLEPWVQWVTVHSGLRPEEHGMSHLDEGHKLKADRVWDVLSRAGHPVWVCGSMNAGYQPGFSGALVPDPWCTKVEPVPQELSTYFRFIQQNVTEYSNDRVPLSKGDYARFLTFLATHGLSASTVTDIVRQLASERLNPDEKWRRVVLLDKLQFDVFRAYYRKLRPTFSTFFLNSTAHFQHTYWREMEPEAFSVHVDRSGGDRSSAIRYGYQRMDAMLGEFMDLAGTDTTLVFCTALSQQPYLKFEDKGGAVFHRPRSFTDLARLVGLPPYRSVAPVMTHQFHLEFDDEATAASAERLLQALRMDGKAVLQTELQGSRLFTGCQVYRPVTDDAQMTTSDGVIHPFLRTFYQIQDAMKSGMHHPDGMFWVRTPARTHSVAPDRVPLVSVAPTLLSLFDLPKPHTMTGNPLPIVAPSATLANG
jgi:hypothetical protein